MREQTHQRIRDFIHEREWEQFHTPANLAKSISIESNELLECFQWDEDKFDLDHVKEELADVIIYCRDLLDVLGLDVDEIVNSKLNKNAQKYPLAKSKGCITKYNKL